MATVQDLIAAAMKARAMDAEDEDAILIDAGRKSIDGLEKAREYLRTEALKKPTTMFRLRCDSADDLDFMRNKVRLLPIDNYHPAARRSSLPAVMHTKASPVILALLLEEYDAAEKLVDAIDVLSLRSIGGWGYEGTSHALTLEILLYLPDCKIPEKLREKILGRLEKEGDDLDDWSLRHVAGFADEGVRQKFVSDVRKHPKLFGQNCLYAWDLETLDFMLTVFPSDDCANALLMHKSTIIWKNYQFWLASEDLYLLDREKINKKIPELSQIVKKLENRRNTHTNLYTLLIFFISYLRRITNASGEEKLVWKMMDALPFEERDFTSLLNNPQLDARIDIIYKLAFRKLGKRLPICGMDTLTKALGMDGLMRGCKQSMEEKGRAMNLLQYVSNIEYPDTFTPGERREYLSRFMIRGADEMKDIFVDLLRKGFVPMEDLEYVMEQIEDKKKCEYMRPFLILQKFEGLPEEDGEKPPGGKTG